VTDWVLGVIGGSGLYDIPGLEKLERRPVHTPWGEPSDELLFGALENGGTATVDAEGGEVVMRYGASLPDNVP